MTDDPKKIEDEFSDSGGLNRRNALQETYRTHPRGWFHWLFDHIHPVPGLRILDLGCGTGDFWIENMRRLWEDWSIVLSDSSPAMMKEVSDRIDFDRSSFHHLLLDAQSVPFPPASFDMVLAIGLFDILPDSAAAFDEVHRVLRPGGRLYATAGGTNHLAEFEELLRPVLPEVRFGGLPDRFGLENGIERLSPWFDHLAVHHYIDRLVFDRPEPVMDYLLSEEVVSSDIEAEQVAVVVERIQQRLQRQGAFEVKREKGVFIGERRQDIYL
jgi:SAM-dependent methyltransferase